MEGAFDGLCVSCREIQGGALALTLVLVLTAIFILSLVIATHIEWYVGVSRMFLRKRIVPASLKLSTGA